MNVFCTTVLTLLISTIVKWVGWMWEISWETTKDLITSWGRGKNGSGGFGCDGIDILLTNAYISVNISIYYNSNWDHNISICKNTHHIMMSYVHYSSYSWALVYSSILHKKYTYYTYYEYYSKNSYPAQAKCLHSGIISTRFWNLLFQIGFLLSYFDFWFSLV